MNTRQAEFLSKMLCTCWNIDKLRGRTVLSGMVRAFFKNERPDEDVSGNALPKMQLLGDVALIPLYGILGIDVPDWLKEFGIDLTDANDIEEELEEALEDENVRMIVIDVDSPGGLAIAGDKLFALVEAANRRKPVLAFCGDGRSMASAAYEAVAGATVLYCGPYADGVGCIGSYLAYLDDTEFWAQMGITWEIFKSGEIKGIGESVPLTEAQRSFLQEKVNRFGANIRRNVSRYRLAIAPDDMEGQWYDGIEAARRGFVGANVSDLQTAIAKFRPLISFAA